MRLTQLAQAELMVNTSSMEERPDFNFTRFILRWQVVAIDSIQMWPKKFCVKVIVIKRSSASSRSAIMAKNRSCTVTAILDGEITSAKEPCLVIWIQLWRSEQVILPTSTRNFIRLYHWFRVCVSAECKYKFLPFPLQSSVASASSWKTSI